MVNNENGPPAWGSGCAQSPPQHKQASRLQNLVQVRANAKVIQPIKEVTKDGGLHEAQVDIPWSAAIPVFDTSRGSLTDTLHYKRGLRLR
jgi:hypothetical protein